MSRFYERIIKEFPKLLFRKNLRKEKYISVRILERREDGVIRPTIDIRMYLSGVKRAGFTEQGFYFHDIKILDTLINYLIEARKEMKSGSNQAGRNKNPIRD